MQLLFNDTGSYEGNILEMWKCTMLWKNAHVGAVFCFWISVCEHERESRLKIEQTQQSETDTATIYREILMPVYLMPHKILCVHTHTRSQILKIGHKRCYPFVCDC